MEEVTPEQLKRFISRCETDPFLLSDPAFSFFRNYLESLALLPASAYTIEEIDIPEAKAVGGRPSNLTEKMPSGIPGFDMPDRFVRGGTHGGFLRGRGDTRGGYSRGRGDMCGGYSGGVKPRDKMDPELMAAFRDPEIRVALKDALKDPASRPKHEADPKVGPTIAKIMSTYGGPK